jgi:protein-tyrosine phosphatase
LAREFHWVIEGQLAGSALPGLLDEVDDDLAFIRRAGIEIVVSLTESPPDLPFADHGLQAMHFPIDDMGFPTPRATVALCRTVEAALSLDRPVLMHCRAGLGRTGMMLAAFLISRGTEAEEAVRRVRRVCPRYIQTESQQSFLRHFAELVRDLAPRPLAGSDGAA